MHMTMADNKWNVKNNSVILLWSVITQVLQKPNHHTVIKILSDYYHYLNMSILNAFAQLTRVIKYKTP